MSCSHKWPFYFPFTAIQSDPVAAFSRTPNKQQHFLARNVPEHDPEHRNVKTVDKNYVHIELIVRVAACTYDIYTQNTQRKLYRMHMAARKTENCVLACLKCGAHESTCSVYLQRLIWIHNTSRTNYDQFHFGSRCVAVAVAALYAN